MSDFRFIGRGVYSIPEAAALIGLSPSRIRRWTQGYEFYYRGRRKKSQPLIGHVEANRWDASSMSFLDLVEILYLEHFRHAGVSFTVPRLPHRPAGPRLRPRYPARETRPPAGSMSPFLFSTTVGPMSRLFGRCRPPRPW